MEIGKVTLGELPEELRQYLTDLYKATTVDQSIKTMIPVYHRDGDNVYFIEDYILHDNKTFEKTAPAGLYRGGALLSLMTDYGQVVIPDERFGWLRLIGGIARFDEGDDLTKTAIREAVVEELAVLSKDEKTRFVPKGIDGVSLNITGWGFSAEQLQEIGEIEIVNHFFNDANRALEIVVQWTVEGELKIFHNEDWFKGGMSGITPMMVDYLGRIVGIYSGRQGLIKIPAANVSMKLHPTLASILNII